MIPTLYLLFLPTLTQSMEILQKLPSHGVISKNNPVWSSTTPFWLKWNYLWLIILEIFLIISQKILKENQKHRPHTTFWYWWRCNQTVPNWLRPFTSFFGTDIMPVKSSLTRHTIGNLFSINYSNMSWYIILKETDNFH